MSMNDVRKLLGRSGGYLSWRKSRGTLSEADIKAIGELMDIDMAILLGGKPVVQEKQEKPKDDVVTVLIAEIGELRAEIEEMKKRLDNPVEVSVPMNAKDMAIRVMGNLLDGGWTTKDAVLVEFNKHHIPIEYISDALKANGAISATSGVADKARTFYIRESEIVW